MKRNAFTFSLLLIVLAVGFSSCKPRTNRSRTPAKSALQTPSSTQSPSAKQILARTDSAIQRVAAMNTDEPERPPVAQDDPGAARTPWGSSYVPKPNPTEYEVYQAGLGAYNSGQYDQAIGAFSQTVVAGRPPELVPNAYYWMGESYFAMQRYAESLPYFEYVTNAGPEYKRSMAFYKLSLASHYLGNGQAANLWYERLRNEYPGSSYSKKLAALGMR